MTCYRGMSAWASAAAVGIRSWLNAGLAFFYPEICQICKEAKATPSEGFVCRGCRSEAHFIERPFCECCGRPLEGNLSGTFECRDCREVAPFFSRARAAVASRGKVLEVIHRYKYQRALWFEPFLAQLLIERASPDLAQGSWDWIVPVPLHSTKQREREFNQAERLARRLSAAVQIPMKRRMLRRVVPTRTQTLLSREERAANVRDAFAFRGTEPLNGERIVVIDDVLTTGATTNACARVLRRAGADDVCVWTVARGI